ncbi:competence/damage-inducible protein A [Clostridium carnis]
MKAEIISIGTEILLGDIVNTNAQFLSQELALLGIDVYHQQVVGDNEERILEAFEKSYERCDLIVTTGGLGPTQDDLTKELAAKYFNKKLILHEPSLKALEKYLGSSDKKSLEANRKQAYFQEGCKVLPNLNGTAPGALINENNKIMIILPGPPKEVIPMFKNYVVNELQGITGTIIKSKTVRLIGIGESLMSEIVDDLINESTNPTVAPYAKDKDVILRITAKGKDEEECINLIDPVYKVIESRLGEYIYGEGEISLENKVAEILCKSNLTIATAESCTGGMIASTLISYPGISEVFMEGVVTYSNEAKIKRLGVKKETLDKFGAVSKETAKEMVEGIAKEANTNTAIATTGIAGPGGGTEEKPVGLVYIGVYVNGNVKVKKFNFKGNRENIRSKATMYALNMLRKEIEKI